MATDNADFYMFVNEWVWSKSRHGCSFGVTAWTEMEIRCVKGMCGLNPLPTVTCNCNVYVEAIIISGSVL